MGFIEVILCVVGIICLIGFASFAIRDRRIQLDVLEQEFEKRMEESFKERF
ncbi:MAG: hypothetical protein KAS32_11460 [Candidatus Peribacteraceae bacterium]|nr:hypothetical protein [Candidatus Peribacteraceae bacterium]